MRTIVLLFIASGCSQIRSPQQKSTPQNQQFQKADLGEVRDLDNELFSLDLIDKDAIVIVFASETCATCFEEVQYWKSQFANNNYPTNIYFGHYLLGGYIEDAINWTQENEITWPVIYNTTDTLYQKYCPAIITPCFLIQNNKTNVITQTYNVLKKEDIERITGTWTY